MEMQQKINIRGSINALEKGDWVKIPRCGYKPSYVRVVSSILATDTNKKFSVNVTKKEITVTRIS